MSTTVVLDTNVLVSALINPNGSPGKILEYVKSGQLQVVICAAIEAEYIKVLNRPKFNFAPVLVEGAISYLNAKATRLSPIPQGADFSKDPDDEVFYNLALSAGAYLITGNIDDFPKHELVMTPQQFLESM